VTEEITPGYRTSTASYYQGLLQPKVILDLELQKYGFEVITAHPTVFALEGGRTFTMWDDPEKFVAEIGKFSNTDGETYRKYRAHMQKIAPHMKQLLWEVPVKPGSGKLRDLRKLAGFVWRFRKIGPQFYDIYNLLTMSAYDYLSKFFTSESQAGLGWRRGVGPTSLKSPGSAYMLVRGHRRDGNRSRAGGFMKGGWDQSPCHRRSSLSMGCRCVCPARSADPGPNNRAVGIRLEGARRSIEDRDVMRRRDVHQLLDETLRAVQSRHQEHRQARCSG
jgi:hypothetical protein